MLHKFFNSRMKFFRIDLLTLLISLFILSGCKKEDGIGLTPDNALSGTLVVDTNILINTVPEDSTYTNAVSKTPFGYFKDPLIGATESNLALNLYLPLNTAYTPPSGVAVVDSAIMVLRYADTFYGDSLNSKYKVNVYQLNERPLSTLNYYNTYNWKYNSGTILGTKTFNMRPHTTFQITDIVSGGPDTLKRVPSHIRVPLDPRFFEAHLVNAPAADLRSSSAFQNATTGFFVTMDKAQVGAGGTATILLDSSSVSVYYHSTYLGAIDTGVAVLPVATHAAQIKHTYTAPGVINALANTTTSNSTFYVQSPLGLRAKVSFPNLQSAINPPGGNIVINRAELVITPVTNTIVPYLPQSKLSMYQLDIAKQRIPIQDGTPATGSNFADPRYLGIGAFGGFYTNTNDYHFLLTGYIQDLMSGKTKDYGTYIGAVEFTTTAIPYAAAPPAMGRVVAAGTVTDKTSPDFKYKIKLNVIYTKVIK